MKTIRKVLSSVLIAIAASSALGAKLSSSVPKGWDEDFASAKENAGKYFTPLKIVKGMVDMVDIKEGDEICDPACGVGKFLLEAALKVPLPCPGSQERA